MSSGSRLGGKELIYHSILSPEALGEIIQVEYGLPAPVACFLFRSGVNEIYAVISRGEKYIVRLTRLERNGPVQESACRFELELLEWLHANGVPVAYPLRRESGDALGVIEAPEGKRYYALFQFVEGDVVASPDRQQAYQLGETLAQLHRVANGFSSGHARSPLDLKFLIDEPMRRLRQFPGISAADLETLEQISQSSRESIRRVPTFADGVGIIHGDFWWKNAIFANGKPVLIDFDFCGCGYRAYDVALLSGTAKLFGQPLAADVADSFMSGYQSIRRLSTAELALIPVFEKTRMIWACGLWTTHANVFGSQWFFENLAVAILNLRRSVDGEPPAGLADQHAS